MSKRAFSGIPSDLREAIDQIESTTSQLQAKLANAKSVQAKINELKSSKDFRSPEEVGKLKLVLQTKVSNARKIRSEVEDLESRPGRLTQDQLRRLQSVRECLANLTELNWSNSCTSSQ